MKVMILANSDVGLYKFRRELIERMASEGNDVIIVLPNGKFISDIISLGCRVIFVDLDRRGVNPIKDLSLLVSYYKIIKREKPEIVLTYTIKPNVYGGFACKMRGIPYIANITGLGTSIQNSGLLQRIVLRLYKLSLRKAECVFFQNEQNQTFFQERVLHKYVKTKLIPGSGVNLKEHCFEPYPPEDDGIRFIFIGRIMKDKGIDELVAAAKSIKKLHHNVRFRIIGEFDGDYKEQIESLSQQGIIEPLGFQKDVHFFIKNSHCTILPSYHEGMSNVLLESAASGRPVIATKVSGCYETFDDGITGLSCDSKSSESLIKTIEHFLQMNISEHEAMGKAGRDKMEHEFDRQIVVDAYLHEIEEIKQNNR